MSSTKLQGLVQQLYQLTKEIGELYPGRHFTPDGHLVGSIGECIVAEAYGLQLMPASNKGFDAITSNGMQVEIKTTQGKTVGFRSPAEHVVVVKFRSDGSCFEIYNGPGDLIWQQLSNRKRPSNGQYQISVSKLMQLDKMVGESQRLESYGANE